MTLIFSIGTSLDVTIFLDKAQVFLGFYQCPFVWCRLKIKLWSDLELIRGLLVKYPQRKLHTIKIKFSVKTYKSSEAFLSFLASCWDPDLWLQAHWEPPTITKISVCKAALGITNVKQNGLICLPPFKCA